MTSSFPWSREQSMDALAYANQVRSTRADFKAMLKASTREVALEAVADLIVEPEPWIRTMKVHTLLLALPYVGRVRAGEWLRRAETEPATRVEELTSRQRRALTDILANPELPKKQSDYAKYLRAKKKAAA